MNLQSVLLNGNSLFAKFLIDKYNLKSFHIFDSFEGGLSEFKDKDLRNSSIKSNFEKVRQVFSSSYPASKNKESELTYINKGWIPDVFKTQEEGIALFHIDVDLYEPTLASHQYFLKGYKGGVIVCDDYGYKQFPGAKVAVD